MLRHHGHPRSVAATVGLLMLTAAAAPAQAGPSGLSGPATSLIGAYLSGTRVPCYTQAGEATCPIAAIAGEAQVFYGRLTGQPAQVAVTFVDYQYDATGNVMDLMAIVFREADGRWVPVGRAMNLIGSRLRAVRFGADTIRYEGTVMDPRDHRTDPRGRGTFVLRVTDKGVTFVRPKRP